MEISSADFMQFLYEISFHLLNCVFLKYLHVKPSDLRRGPFDRAQMQKRANLDMRGVGGRVRRAEGVYLRDCLAVLKSLLRKSRKLCY